jgi:hypothetical protein
MALVSKAAIHLSRPDSDTPIEATEMELTRGRPGSELSNVDCYFTVDGHLLAGRLTYWKGDTRQQAYIDTLHQVIESLHAADGGGAGGRR